MIKQPEIAVAGTQSGMGAVSGAGGVTFRVWAPFATAVHVGGDFNDWSVDSTPLVLEQDGYWSCDSPSARPGSLYKFIIEGTNGKQWKIDPYAARLDATATNCIVDDRAYVWAYTNYATPSLEQLVVYEMHVGTFFDEGSGGTLATAAQKLDYLCDLGINAIEFMPLGQFSGERSWGYNPAYPFAIDNGYGDGADLKHFIDEAHRRGMIVIVDVVYNHFGDTDLWQFDGWSQDGHGGIYFYNDWRRVTPYGETRPDYGRVEVRQYLRDNAMLWLEEYRADGLRWDATAWVRNVFGNQDDPASDLPDGWMLMQSINDEMDRKTPWKISIAEDLRGNGYITKDTGAGGAGFSTQWSTGEFLRPIRDAVITGDDSARDMYAVRDAIERRFNESAFTRTVYTENHDEDANGSERLPELIWPGNAGSWFSRKRSTLAAGIALTAPGIPMIFNGQEFLADSFFSDGRSLNWNRLSDFAAVHQFYTDAIHLRRNWFNNTRGLSGQGVNVFHVNNDAKLVAFHRYESGGPGDDVVVVANFANVSYESYTIGFPHTGPWYVRLNSDWSGYGNNDYGNAAGYDTRADFGGVDGMPARGNIGIGPYTLLILSQ
jgi:1,4-alpha-glucan branching enzyme